MDPSDLTFQTVSIFDQPSCHSAPGRQTDRQTHRHANKWLEALSYIFCFMGYQWLEGMFDDYWPLWLYTELRDLIILTSLHWCTVKEMTKCMICVLLFFILHITRSI